MTTLIGMVAGYLLNILSIQSTIQKITNHFVNIFMILLLPPIIFESGYNMSKAPFFRNIGTILMFSFVGTFISIFFASIFFYLSGTFGWSYEFSIKDSFAFGSVISATDTVSVLSIFKAMDADENLYAIVFGESVFNDAICIVMYDTIKNMGNDSTKSPVVQILGAAGKFCLKFSGSVVVGAMTALIVAFVLKRQADYSKTVKFEKEDSTQNKNVINHEFTQSMNTEISMILMCPWVCYLMADGLELSGIVAILTNGIFLNYYGLPNVSRTSKTVSKIAIDTMAYVAETVVFLFLGIGVFTFDHQYDKMGIGTLGLTILNLNIARFVSMQTVAWFVNKSRTEKSKISTKAQLVQWIAGLRGAMAYALGIESQRDLNFNNPSIGKYTGDVMLVLTIVYSIFTILGVSTFLHPIMKKCEVTAKPPTESPEKPLSEEARKKKMKSKCHRLKLWLQRFDRNYFSPLFIYNHNVLIAKEMQLNEEKRRKAREARKPQLEEEKSTSSINESFDQK